MPIFRAKVAALCKVRAELDEVWRLMEAAGVSMKELESLERQLRQDLLQIGAVGRLLMAGKIEAVLPLEDADAYEAADPMTEDGTVILDSEKIEARQLRRPGLFGRDCLSLDGR